MKKQKTQEEELRKRIITLVASYKFVKNDDTAEIYADRIINIIQSEARKEFLERAREILDNNVILIDKDYLGSSQIDKHSEVKTEWIINKIFGKELEGK